MKETELEYLYDEKGNLIFLTQLGTENYDSRYPTQVIKFK